MGKTTKKKDFQKNTGKFNLILFKKKKKKNFENKLRSKLKRKKKKKKKKKTIDAYEMGILADGFPIRVGVSEAMICEMTHHVGTI